MITALNLCVGAGRCAGPRVTVWNCLVVLPIVDVHVALAGWLHRVCADLAGCYEIPIWCLVRLRWFVALRGHVGRPSPMVTTGLCRIDFLVLTIVNGARPGSRRLIPDLQPPMAERTGSRHARSSFHPSSRLARSSFNCGWTVHKPPRRGGPLCPPVLPDSYIHFGMCFRGQACKLSPTPISSPRSTRYSRHPQRGHRCTSPPRRKHRVKLKSRTHPRQVRSLALHTASGG